MAFLKHPAAENGLPTAELPVAAAGWTRRRDPLRARGTLATRVRIQLVKDLQAVAHFDLAARRGDRAARLLALAEHVSHASDALVLERARLIGSVLTGLVAAMPTEGGVQ